MSTGAKAPRVAVADTLGCENCQLRQEGMLFTLCMHEDAKYIVDEKEQFHTIQHMRDKFVGECGEEMKLRKPITVQPKSKGDGRKWDRSKL